ncbi:MAG: helix-turn-helix domain-containing protein [Bacteroidaceae bacterium]|nr:helix-turn-helix domain-containing protein [Bacteroidaceae bacterium]
MKEKETRILIVDADKFDDLIEKVDRLCESLSINKEKAKEDYLDSEEVMRTLGICRKTWQNYRDKKIIPYTKISRKIYVKRSDLEKFMQTNIINSRYA